MSLQNRKNVNKISVHCADIVQYGKKNIYKTIDIMNKTYIL